MTLPISDMYHLGLVQDVWKRPFADIEELCSVVRCPAYICSWYGTHMQDTHVIAYVAMHEHAVLPAGIKKRSKCSETHADGGIRSQCI